jgi:hypothetical protein
VRKIIWLDFEKSGKNIEFNVQTVIFGFPEKEYMGLNFVNLLVPVF